MRHSDEAYLPTPEEIKAHCAALQSTWTKTERLKRSRVTLERYGRRAQDGQARSPRKRRRVG